MRIIASPVLPARCLDATTGFYAPLGFQPLFREDLPGGYLVLHREAVALPFVRQPACATDGEPASFHIDVDDVDQCHAEWRAGLPAAAAQRLGAVRTTPSGREFALIDLDGTLLRVCERPG